jgi:hypothetical protein
MNHNDIDFKKNLSESFCKSFLQYKNKSESDIHVLMETKKKIDLLIPFFEKQIQEFGNIDNDEKTTFQNMVDGLMKTKEQLDIYINE